VKAVDAIDPHDADKFIRSNVLLYGFGPILVAYGLTRLYARTSVALEDGGVGGR
jgi:hypothetical protein